MQIIRDDLWLCSDCLFAAVNGDYSGLAYMYDEDEAELRRRQIVAGLAELGAGLVPADDSDEGVRFSSRACDCCRTSLAGDRHRFAVLG